LNLLTEILDFFLPRICPVCGSRLSLDEKYICAKCLDRIQLASDDRLSIEFKRKFLEKKIISGFTSLYVFEEGKEFQQIIHALKYNGRFQLGTFLGERLCNPLKEKLNEWRVDVIVPIPLHQLKRAERGYNQSLFIAKGLGKVLNIPVNNNIVKRIRFTQTQTAMNLFEREKNVRNAFKVKKPHSVTGKNILIIDDVITTGATVSECGRILLENGAHMVYVASVAIAD